MYGDWPSAEETARIDTPVRADGGIVECTDKLCSGAAAFALWMGEKFSRVHHPPAARDLDDGDLAPYVCEDCLPRYENRHGEHGEFVRPEERLVTDGGFAQPAPIEQKQDRDWNDADVGDRLEAYADAVASVPIVEEIVLYPGGALDAVKVKLPYGTTVDGRLLKPALDFGLGVAGLGTHHLRIVPGTEVHD